MSTAGKHMRHADSLAEEAPPQGGWAALACLLVATAIVVLVTLAQPPKYATPDDFMQHLYARGAYFDTPGLLMLYSLAPISAPLCLLYSLVPAVPWYPVVLLGLIAASSAAMLCIVVRMSADAPLRMLLITLVVCCEIMASIYLSYTVVAFVSFAAGVALILAHAGFVRPTSVRAGDVGGYLLVIAGFSLRPESGLAAAAVFAPFLAWALLRNRNARTLLMAAGVVVSMAACYLVGHAAWHMADGWQSYDEAFSAAQAVADYPRVSLSEAQRVAPQLSENDLAMIYEFLFVDADTYDVGTFQALDTVVQRYGVSTLIDAVLARPTFTAFVVVLALLLFGLAALICRARGLRGGERGVAFGVPVVVSLLLLAVFLRARPKMHVVLPLFMVGAYALIVAALMRANKPQDRSPFPALPSALPVAGALAAVALTGFIELKYALPLQRSLDADITPAMQSYVDEHPNQLVAFTLSQGGLMNYDAFAFDAWDHPQNAVFIGGYEYYTAPWQTFLARSGLSRDAFLLNLLDGERMVSVGTSEQAEMIQTYLSEHADAQVDALQVASLGTGTQSSSEYAVWRYVSTQGAAQGEREELGESTVVGAGAVTLAEGEITVGGDGSAAQGGE